MGSIVGIYLFLEAFPLLEGIYVASPMGNLTMQEVLGISPLWFAVSMSMMAISIFVLVSYIENRVNGRAFVISGRNVWKMAIVAVVPFFFLAVTGFTPDKKERINGFISDPENLKKCNVKMIDPDKLAFEITNNHYNYFIIDLRDPEKYKRYHLPLAVNIPLDSMLNREWEIYFKQTIRTNIFYADGTLQAKKACKLSELLGKANGLVLNTSPESFRKQFYEPVHPPEGASKDEMNLYYFRIKSNRA